MVRTHRDVLDGVKAEAVRSRLLQNPFAPFEQVIIDFWVIVINVCLWDEYRIPKPATMDSQT